MLRMCGCATTRLGEVEARTQRGGHRPRLLLAHQVALRARVDEPPDATLAELRAWLLRERGVSARIGSVWGKLTRMA